MPDRATPIDVDEAQHLVEQFALRLDSLGVATHLLQGYARALVADVLNIRWAGEHCFYGPASHIPTSVLRVIDIYGGAWMRAGGIWRQSAPGDDGPAYTDTGQSEQGLLLHYGPVRAK